MAAPARPTRWLFGPVPDLLLGCGGAYAVVWGLQSAAGAAMREWLPFGLLPLLVLFTGIPHYGATLIRVYERREDRTAYRLFALWATLVVYAWFGLAVYDVALGSWLVTLYLTWSPWHYTGQNYGIAVMFLHRRGVRVTPEAKRLVYASFLLSYVIAFLGSHAATHSATYAPVTLTGSSYRFLRLGIPEEIYAVLLPLAVCGWIFSTARGAQLLRREGSWSDLGPAGALALLQAAWFSLPVLSRASGVLQWLGPFDIAHAEYAFLWVAIGHSVQYLWVTTYYAIVQDRAERRPRYLLKTWLAGGAIWGIPLLVFSPDLLGVRAYDAGLALLVASAVNIHHFILDGAIWKLRDGRIARILLRRGEDPTPIAPGPERRGAFGAAVRTLMLAGGLAYGLATLVGTLEFEFGVRRASDPPDYPRLRAAAERLRWVGRDNAAVRYNLGMHAVLEGGLDEARRELRRSLDLAPSAEAWVALGLADQREQRWAQARDAYAEALAIDPHNVAALSRSAGVWLQLGEPDRARQALGRAVELAPERDDLRRRLARLAAP